MAMPVIFTERTTDRITYRKCRRRWDLGATSRQNLTTYDQALPLWTGTGIHFGLEDIHGHKKYPKGSEAFRAFAKAWGASGLQYPTGWEEDLEMSVAMLDYYEEHWLANREPLQTLWVDGIPQCEILWKIELPWEEGKFGYDKVFYRGTFDRIIEDENGLLWIVEYKSAKQPEFRHFQTDQQVTTYCWAASIWYNRPVQGVVYQQHKKTLPDPPAILASGRLSLNKSQITSYKLYKDELLRQYGSSDKFPNEYIEFLNRLAAKETEHRDAYVERELIERNEYQLAADQVKMMQELEEKLNPDTPMYPNPTRECGYCPFESVCVSMDDGSFWEDELEETTFTRSEEDESWRSNL